MSDGTKRFEVVGDENDSLIVFTNLLAPKGQVVLFSTNEENHGRVLIPESNAMLTQLRLLDGRLLCLYCDSLREKFVVHKLNGESIGEWNIPLGYAVTDISGTATDSLAIYSFQSFYTPPTVYQVNLRTLLRRAVGKTLINYNYQQFNTIILTYKSNDSTEIPLYVTYKKGLQLTGNNPLLLYGYGGFDIPAKPFYDPANVAFLLRGGMLAVPAIRGGGDFPGWHVFIHIHHRHGIIIGIRYIQKMAFGCDAHIVGITSNCDTIDENLLLSFINQYPLACPTANKEFLCIGRKQASIALPTKR